MLLKLRYSVIRFLHTSFNHCFPVSTIKEIKIETSPEKDADCRGGCLRLEVCQSDVCCSTKIIQNLPKGTKHISYNHNKLGNCKDFSIDENLPIEFTFNHESTKNDGWKGEQASVHLHQHDENPYVCPISNWLNDESSYTITCESPFIVSQYIIPKKNAIYDCAELE